jgi:hypothetical protein
MLKRAAAPALTVVLLAIASGPAVSAPQGSTLFVPAGFGAGHFSNPGAAPTRESNQIGRVVDLKPARLVIPSIRLDARIEPRGLDAKRNLDTAADPNDAAWFDLGPAPGQPGNAIINGHVDWWTGSAVFTKLGRVRPGDTIEIIRADGGAVLFRITALQRVTAGSRVASLFEPSSSATLTLITCAGVWNPLTRSDSQRLLVRATIV